MIRELGAYKKAVDESTEPISLVYLNNQFAYCNKAWCQLTGYPESELLEMTWMDITVKTDIGGDMAEVQAVIDGHKEDYYNEKRYIKKNGSRIDVGLYVHRYPTAGTQIGWVVFGKELNGSSELDTLKARFEEIEKMILMFKDQDGRIDNQEKESAENRQLLLSLIGKGETTVNAPQGDQIRGNNNSTNRTTNENKVIFAVIGAVGLLCTVLVTVAAVLAYMAYVSNNNPNMQPPNIQQHDLSPQGDK